MDIDVGGGPTGGGTPGGNMPMGGRRAMNAVIAAALGGGPSGLMPGGMGKPQGGIIAGIPGRGGPMCGAIRRAPGMPYGALGSFPDL